MPRQKISKEEREATGKKAKTDAPGVRVVTISEFNKPQGMSKAAASLWDDIFLELIDHGLLSAANAGTMADFCEIEVQKKYYRDLFQKRSKHITKHKNNTQSQSLEYKMYLSLSKESTRLAAVLGITPGERKKQNVVFTQKAEGASRVPEHVRKEVLG